MPSRKDRIDVLKMLSADVTKVFLLTTFRDVSCLGVDVRRFA